MIILSLLIIFCIGATISSVSALDTSNSTDKIFINEENSIKKLNPSEFSDNDAKDWEVAKLEELDEYVDKSLPSNDIQELRTAKNGNQNLVKEYTYQTSDGYKLVKIKSTTYKTVYVDKYSLKDLKNYDTTDYVYKKIPKSIHNIKYDKKLSKKIRNNEWEIKKIKKVKKTYKWKSTKWMEKKLEAKKFGLQKKLKLTNLGLTNMEICISQKVGTPIKNMEIILNM